MGWCLAYSEIFTLIQATPPQCNKRDAIVEGHSTVDGIEWDWIYPGGARYRAIYVAKKPPEMDVAP